jgi:hypothetical protein
MALKLAAEGSRPAMSSALRHRQTYDWSAVPESLLEHIGFPGVPARPSRQLIGPPSRTSDLVNVRLRDQPHPASGDHDASARLDPVTKDYEALTSALRKELARTEQAVPSGKGSERDGCPPDESRCRGRRSAQVRPGGCGVVNPTRTWPSVGRWSLRLLRASPSGRRPLCAVVRGSAVRLGWRSARWRGRRRRRPRDGAQHG